MKRALCIWLPNWPLQRLAAARAELSQQAVVLYALHPSGGAKVAAYCPRLATAAAALWEQDLPSGDGGTGGQATRGTRAGCHAHAGVSMSGNSGKTDRVKSTGGQATGGSRATGIHPGIPLAEATALFLLPSQERTHPPVLPLPSRERAGVRGRINERGDKEEKPSDLLHLEPIDPAADLVAIDELAQWCHRFSPSVGLEEAAAPESLLLDVTGLGRLFGGERTLAQRIVRAFQKRGLTARVAIADTLGAAWAVAHFADLEIQPGATGGLSTRVMVSESGCHAHAGVSMPENSDKANHVKSTGGQATRGTRRPGNSDKANRVESTGGQATRGTRRPGNSGATVCSSDSAILSAISIPLIIPSSQTRDALAPLPPAALRLPAETCALLADLGVRRIGQLAAIRRETLLSRFGPLVLERLDQATGAAAEAIVARVPPPEWLFEQLFEHPTGRREMIEWALGQLVGQACAALARERRGMLRLECCFQFERRSPARFVVGFYRPSASERHVGDLVRLKLEHLRFREPLVAIRLRVLAIDRLEFRQRELFAGQGDCRSPRELAALVDRLSNRLGPHAVVRPWLLASAQPEFACQYRPVSSLPLPWRGRAGVRGKKVRREKARGEKTSRRSRKKIARKPESNTDPLTPDPSPARGEGREGDRPLHLESEPRPLVVWSVAPEGPPVKFRLAGRDQRIARAWGPERIETGWWRGGCVRRDYYQVETARGERYWLFRELNTGRWFLHGSFA